MLDLNNKEHLCKILSFFYLTMIASAPLLEFAIPRADGALREYYAKHWKEERGHDLMVLDDLTRLGCASPVVSHHAAQFAGSQYYLIAHVHPSMLLGYMRALEGNSLPVSEIDRLSKLHGTELTALRHHCLHDPTHRRDLNAIIATLATPLRSGVEWNETETRRMLGNLETHIG